MMAELENFYNKNFPTPLPKKYFNMSDKFPYKIMTNLNINLIKLFVLAGCENSQLSTLKH